MAQLYLKFDGAGASADLKGTVERPTYKDQMAIDSFSFAAIHEGGRPATKDKGKFLAGNAAPTDIALSKVAGPESPGLLTACLKGAVIDKATITMDGSSEDKAAEPIYTIELELVVIKTVGWGGGSGGGEASVGEQISLTYDKMTVTHNRTSKIMSYSASTSAAG